MTVANMVGNALSEATEVLKGPTIDPSTKDPAAASVLHVEAAFHQAISIALLQNTASEAGKATNRLTQG